LCPPPKFEYRCNHLNTTMDSSSGEEDPNSMEENTSRLVSLMDGVVTDFGLVQTKVGVASLDIFKQSVQPLRGVMHGVWGKLSLGPTAPFNLVLERLFQTAQYLDRPKRVVHFTDEFALLFGKSYMSLFELVGILIDSLEFVPPLGPPA
jgi:hypothetical protein